MSRKKYRVLILVFCFLVYSCEEWNKEEQIEKKNKEYIPYVQLFALNTIQYSNEHPPCKTLSCVTHESQFYTLGCRELSASITQCPTDPCQKYQTLGVEIVGSEKSCSNLGFNFQPATVAKCYYNSYPKYSSTFEKCPIAVVENAMKAKLSLLLDNNALPTVSSTKPVDEFTSISKDDLVNIVFSEQINSKTLTSANIAVTVAGNPVTLTILTGSSNVNILPSPASNSWLTGQVYTVTISGNIQDEYGNKMNQDYTFKFQAN